MLHAKTLAKQLYFNTLSKSTVLLHILLSMILSSLCLMPHTFLPLLYYGYFSIAQNYAQAQGTPDILAITIYHDYDTVFLAIISIILLIGISFCYAHYHKKSYSAYFIRDYLVLTTPICLRILFITIFFAGLVLGIIASIFLYKYTLLQKTSLPKANYFNPIKFIFKALTLVPFLQEGAKQLKTLFKAQALFTEINTASLVLYYAAYSFAILELIWYFRTMKKYLSFNFKENVHASQ